MSVPLMLITRNKHKAIIGPDGNLYVIGGITIDNELVAEVERFNFSTSTWELAGKLNVPRYGFGVSIYDNKIYIYGGALPGSNVTNSIEYYDGVSWKEAPFGMPFTFGNFASVSYDDRVYLAIGGLRQLRAFSLKNGESFEVPGLMNHIRNRHSMSSIGDRLYVIGGYNQDGEGVGPIECYDLASQTWSTTGALNTPRWFHTSLTYDNKIYILGGKIANSVVLDGVEQFDGNTCTNIDYKLPTATALHSTVMVKNEVYVIQSGLRSVETFLLPAKIPEVIPPVVVQPERRVFTVDVGDLSPTTATTFVEEIKNEVTPTVIPPEVVTQPSMNTQIEHPTPINPTDLFFVNRDGFNILTDSAGNVYPIHGWRLGDSNEVPGIRIVNYDPITKNVTLA
jgi:hypothetical protein